MPFEAIASHGTGWGATDSGPEIEVRLDPELTVERSLLPPLFLVGEVSSRERLRDLLDGRTGISFGPGTAFLHDLVRAARDNWVELCQYGYPEQYWMQRVARFFDSLQHEKAASRGRTRWAAQCAEHDLRLMDRLFPTCQVIHVLPAGRPSHLTRATAAKGPQMFRSRYHQVAGGELLSDPEGALDGVLAFLGEHIEAPSRA